MLFHYFPYQFRNSLRDSPLDVSINIDSLRSTVCIQVDYILVYFQERITCCLGNNCISRLTTFGRYTPTTLKSFNDFKSYAKARGTGFQMIDFQQHCVIAMMLYAKYKTRNIQSVLGLGGANNNPATTTGSSNATGCADTKNESSKYVCGLGLEGVFGGIYEWVEGVEINNRVWKITDPDGSTRNVNAGTSNGWITNIAAENGPFFDVVPTNVGGSDSTHYSDYYSQTSSNSIVLARSYSGSDTSSGVCVCVSQRVEREFVLRFAPCFPWNHI